VLLAGGVAHADPKSDALIAKAVATAKAAKSLTATVEMSASANGQTSTQTASVRLLKPNLARLVITSGAPDQQMQMVLTGKDGFLIMPSQKQYQQIEGVTDPTQSPLTNMGSPLTGSFFDATLLKGLVAGGTTTFGGKKLVGKTPYQTLVLKRTTPAPVTVTAYFGAAGLWEGVEVTIPPPPAAQLEPGAPKPTARKISWWLRNVKLNAPLPAKEFAYTPPDGFTRFNPGARNGPDELEKSLLAVGKPAPYLELPRPGGEKLILADVLRDKKAVLVNFWFADCPPCKEEFPRLQKLYEQFKEKGFDIIAVNANDPEARIQKFIADGGITFPVVMGGEGPHFTIGKEYGVQAFPTNYLVGPDGNILWRGVGFKEDELIAALEKAGVK
jgi:peroxiredoxin/outer membrane lipoprotein-sorting protein